MSTLRRTVWILMAALMLLGPVGPAVSAEAAISVCEKALIYCMSAPGHNLPWDIVECISGYAFCREYILPLLDGK
ncbi:MAG: hypothetical protein PHI34_11745 [Acidobacteriota bacterium]|nr:hypothetical protein [Acidobacteriota bacterium]